MAALSAHAARPTPNTPVLLHAARKLGRPISWVASRSEDFLTDSHGRGIRLTGELALDGEGRFLALRALWLCDEGAYLTTAGALTNTINGQAIAAGPYRTPVMYGRHRLVMTNATPTNAYRGAGRPEAVYLIERLVAAAAAQLGIDPIELRRRNAIPHEAMPYRTPSGGEFDSGDFPALLHRVESGVRMGRLPRPPRRLRRQGRAPRHRRRPVPRTVRRRRRAHRPGRDPLRPRRLSRPLPYLAIERAGA